MNLRITKSFELNFIEIPLSFFSIHLLTDHIAYIIVKLKDQSGIDFYTILS